jgi:hypothetical protein
LSAKDEGFLSRWSRRKTEARAGGVPETAPESAPDRSTSSVPRAGEAGAPPGGGAVPAPPQAPEAQLPAVESLTPHSEISAFMRPEVDPALRGRALKTLFSDPALYPMDGLDVYIDDYTKPDPLPEGWLEKLNQFATLHGEPPAPEATPPAATAQADAAPSRESPEPAEQQASAEPSDTSVAPSVARDSPNPDAT